MDHLCCRMTACITKYNRVYGSAGKSMEKGFAETSDLRTCTPAAKAASCAASAGLAFFNFGRIYTKKKQYQVQPTKKKLSQHRSAATGGTAGKTCRCRLVPSARPTMQVFKEIEVKFLIFFFFLWRTSSSDCTVKVKVERCQKCKKK